LDDYGIPHVAIVEGDDILKTYRKDIARDRDARAEAKAVKP
jgi:hypothetical protein